MGLGCGGGGGLSPRPKGPGGGVGRAGMLPSQRSRDKGSWSCGWGGHPFQNGFRVLKGSHGLEGWGGHPSPTTLGDGRSSFPILTVSAFLGDAWVTHTGGSSPWTWGGGRHRVPCGPWWRSAPSQQPCNPGWAWANPWSPPLLPPQS